MADLQAVAESLIKGQAPEVEQGVQQALDEGVPVREILHDGLIAGMNVVGAKFKNNEFYIPEVLIAARAMKAGMELIRPRLVEEKVEPAGIAAVGTVKGDLHDIGKNLVAMMLEGAGFDVVDLASAATTEWSVTCRRRSRQIASPRFASLSSPPDTCLRRRIGTKPGVCGVGRPHRGGRPARRRLRRQWEPHGREQGPREG